MFRKSGTDLVPVVTLDDKTLLIAEKETRYQYAKAGSRIVGSSVSLAMLSPMAVYGIAKSSAQRKRSYWSHEELLTEVNRRGLTPLPKTAEESTTALVGGQVAAVIVGHVVGGDVADAVVGAVGGGIIHKATEKIAENATEFSVVNGVDAFAAAASVGGGERRTGTNAEGEMETFSLPPPPLPPRTQMPQKSFLFSLFPAMQSSSGLSHAVIAATEHLGGRWAGFAMSEIQELEPESRGDPKVSDSSVFSLQRVKAAIADVHETAHSKLVQLHSTAKTAVSNLTSPQQHPKSLMELSNHVAAAASAVITIVRGNGGTEVTEEVVVPVKYRLAFDLIVRGISVAGRNLVDDLPVSGRCHESGTRIEFMETVEGGDESDPLNICDLVVMYRAKVSGGYMNGTWECSDGRSGTFSAAHI